jgi:DNA (cytosine-5)-methyltransferase 1|tara:strand:- start:563 stop:1486 length:924 start_codon:yes stop_codon:yes gene_type:complete
MIKIGTDCSGIEAPIEALQNICNEHNLSFEHEFSSEISVYATEYIKNNHNPKILFNDMTKRKPTDIPYVDIYVSGFPCQPYSRANKFKTPVDPRLNLFEDCIRVIQTVTPKFFILENVKTLVTLNNGSYFNDILKRLNDIGKYSIYNKVINSKELGIPQSRDRLYIVGVLNKYKKYEFNFPEKKQMLNINNFVDKSNKSKNEKKESNKELFNNVPEDAVFIDTGFRTANFPNSNKWAPCITAQPNMWCVPMERKASVKEYFWLQGFNPDNKKISLSDHRMKILIGNSMTVNIIQKLIENGFKSLNIL